MGLLLIARVYTVILEGVMTCSMGRVGIAAALSTLIIATLAHAANIGIRSAPSVTAPSRGVTAPANSTNPTSPALTQYLCPNPAQFNEKIATNPVAGGWTGDDRLENYYLDSSDHPFIKNGVMYCVYVPGWLTGVQNHPEWYLHQPVGKGTCVVRADYKGFECRQ